MEKYEEEEAKKLSLHDACSFRNEKKNHHRNKIYRTHARSLYLHATELNLEVGDLE
jgi:hypothetical protein